MSRTTIDERQKAAKLRESAFRSIEAVVMDTKFQSMDGADWVASSDGKSHIVFGGPSDPNYALSSACAIDGLAPGTEPINLTLPDGREVKFSSVNEALAAFRIIAIPDPASAGAAYNPGAVRYSDIASDVQLAADGEKEFSSARFLSKYDVPNSLMAPGSEFEKRLRVQLKMMHLSRPIMVNDLTTGDAKFLEDELTDKITEFVTANPPRTGALVPLDSEAKIQAAFAHIRAVNPNFFAAQSTTDPRLGFNFEANAGANEEGKATLDAMEELMKMRVRARNAALASGSPIMPLEALAGSPVTSFTPDFLAYVARNNISLKGHTSIAVEQAMARMPQAAGAPARTPLPEAREKRTTRARDLEAAATKIVAEAKKGSTSDVRNVLSGLVDRGSLDAQFAYAPRVTRFVRDVINHDAYAEIVRKSEEADDKYNELLLGLYARPRPPIAPGTPLEPQDTVRVAVIDAAMAIARAGVEQKKGTPLTLPGVSIANKINTARTAISTYLHTTLQAATAAFAIEKNPTGALATLAAAPQVQTMDLALKVAEYADRYHQEYLAYLATIAGAGAAAAFAPSPTLIGLQATIAPIIATARTAAATDPALLTTISRVEEIFNTSQTAADPATVEQNSLNALNQVKKIFGQIERGATAPSQHAINAFASIDLQFLRRARDYTQSFAESVDPRTSLPTSEPGTVSRSIAIAMATARDFAPYGNFQDLREIFNSDDESITPASFLHIVSPTTPPTFQWLEQHNFIPRGFRGRDTLKAQGSTVADRKTSLENIATLSEALSASCREAKLNLPLASKLAKAAYIYSEPSHYGIKQLALANIRLIESLYLHIPVGTASNPTDAPFVSAIAEISDLTAKLLTPPSDDYSAQIDEILTKLDEIRATIDRQPGSANKDSFTRILTRTQREVATWREEAIRDGVAKVTGRVDANSDRFEWITTLPLEGDPQYAEKSHIYFRQRLLMKSYDSESFISHSKIAQLTARDGLDYDPKTPLGIYLHLRFERMKAEKNLPAHLTYQDYVTSTQEAVYYNLKQELKEHYIGATDAEGRVIDTVHKISDDDLFATIKSELEVGGFTAAAEASIDEINHEIDRRIANNIALKILQQRLEERQRAEDEATPAGVVPKRLTLADVVPPKTPVITVEDIESEKRKREVRALIGNEGHDRSRMDLNADAVLSISNLRDKSRGDSSYYDPEEKKEEAVIKIQRKFRKFKETQAEKYLARAKEYLDSSESSEEMAADDIDYDAVPKILDPKIAAQERVIPEIKGDASFEHPAGFVIERFAGKDALHRFSKMVEDVAQKPVSGAAEPRSVIALVDDFDLRTGQDSPRYIIATSTARGASKIFTGKETVDQIQEENVEDHEKSLAHITRSAAFRKILSIATVCRENFAEVAKDAELEMEALIAAAGSALSPAEAAAKRAEFVVKTAENRETLNKQIGVLQSQLRSWEFDPSDSAEKQRAKMEKMEAFFATLPQSPSGERTFTFDNPPLQFGVTGAPGVTPHYVIPEDQFDIIKQTQVDLEAGRSTESQRAQARRAAHKMTHQSVAERVDRAIEMDKDVYELDVHEVADLKKAAGVSSSSQAAFERLTKSRLAHAPFRDSVSVLRPQGTNNVATAVFTTDEKGVFKGDPHLYIYLNNGSLGTPQCYIHAEMVTANCMPPNSPMKVWRGGKLVDEYHEQGTVVIHEGIFHKDERGRFEHISAVNPTFSTSELTQRFGKKEGDSIREAYERFSVKAMSVSVDAAGVEKRTNVATMFEGRATTQMLKQRSEKVVAVTQSTAQGVQFDPTQTLYVPVKKDIADAATPFSIVMKAKPHATGTTAATRIGDHLEVDRTQLLIEYKLPNGDTTRIPLSEAALTTAVGYTGTDPAGFVKEMAQEANNTRAMFEVVGEVSRTIAENKTAPRTMAQDIAAKFGVEQERPGAKPTPLSATELSAVPEHSKTQRAAAAKPARVH